MGKIKSLGFGLGLRLPHYKEILSRNDLKVDWFEVISENLIGLGEHPQGRPLENVLAVREKFPLVLHGVSLSLGGTDPFGKHYLNSLKELYSIVEPEWVSDHLCWTGVHGKQLHDLLPLPYNEETLYHVLNRLNYVQEFLGRELVIENVSSYLTYEQSEMSEWEFLRELVIMSGAKLLLDVNNVYVSSVNHRFDPVDFFQALPVGSVQQIHLAGHSESGNYLIDTHDSPVCPEVWALYEQSLKTFGTQISTMIERDGNIPELTELEKELSYARSPSQKVKGSKFERSAKIIEPSLH